MASFTSAKSDAARVRLGPAAGVLLGLALLASTAQGFTLTKATFSSGAVGVAGGGYRLGATLGEAGVVGLTSGGSFRLTEGFWFPSASIVSAVGPSSVDPAAPGEEPLGVPTAFAANQPNPFRDATTIFFAISSEAAHAQPVAISVYDMQGRRVRTLLHGTLPAGPHQVRWDGRDDSGRPLAGGVYLSQLAVGRWSETRPVIRIP